MEGWQSWFIAPILKIGDFVKDVVGYELGGRWPEVETLEDLEKVFNALIKVNQPVEEIKEESTPPGEYDWLLG